jgi:hypothetical protein
MIKLLAIAGFPIALATSAQAMMLAPITQPDGMIIQVREGCGVGMVRVNGVCVARSAIRQTRRDYYGNGAYSGDYGTTGYSGNYYPDRGYSGSSGSHGQLTYDQAWAACKKFVDVLPRDAQSQRYSRGAACMHNYGYRI